ncbi:MAG: flippase-like domain-containing protein [bacterium]|nr:flippase-like domain-containing protein [bacterium]
MVSPDRDSRGTDAPEAPRHATVTPWYLNWRFWFGIAVAALSIWYVARGIPIENVLEAMGQADLVLLFVISVPCYVVAAWVRALRWRYLTNPVADIGRAPLFRAQAIGFLVNNILPLRIGEFVRSWYLARQQGVSATSILGTVVVERVIDVVSVLLIAAASLTWAGRGGDTLLARGTLLLLPAACVPVIGLVVIRVFPEQMITIARFVARPLPERIGATLESLLERFAEGLESLTLGSHLGWILWHTIVIWLVLSTIPLLAGIYAFGLELGTPGETLMISWILLAAVGVAVAIPSTPGFFGTYQLAFNSVLERFGVTPAEALALGLLVWFVFWSTLVALGLLVLRSQRTSLGELTLHSGKDPETESR